MERVTWKLNYHMLNRYPVGIFCVAQETQTGALYQPKGVQWGRRWEGVSEGRGYIYTYG